jgi:hypothetical protein
LRTIVYRKEMMSGSPSAPADRMSDARHNEPDLSARRLEIRHHPAEIIFGALAFAFALFLLSQIPAQTTWIQRAAFVRQPAFWPTVSIVGMTLFGAAELWACWRRNRHAQRQEIVSEALDWFRALEYVLWFLAYVWLVPLLGYLPSTVVFCMLLAFRVGYRNPGAVLMAAVVAVATVVVFKAFLSVRIPGGVAYEYLPPQIRNFMILYL